jgi:hypothetical protein
MTSYPIISQRVLPAAERGGLLGLGGRRRQTSELPLPNPHEAVVYKSGGGYVVDDGRTRPRDDHVINATSISVIDMRENKPMMVQTSVPSASAADFTVQVTFLCTVRRPREVVEAGLSDMADPLLQYLTRHPPLFHAGEKHDFEQIHEVRREVASEIRAYVDLKPPRFPGMEVLLGSVQVLTPDELAAYYSKLRERELENRLTLHEQHLQHELDMERDQMAETRRRHTEESELLTRQHEQAMEQLRQNYEHKLRSANLEHSITETQKLAEAMGANESEVPGLWAASAGERTIAETAEVLQDHRERERALAAEEKLRKANWEREDDHARRQDAREDARLQLSLRVEQIKAQMEVAKVAIERGLADDQTFHVLMNAMSGVVRELENAGLPSGGQQEAAPAGQPHKDQARATDTHDTVIDAEMVIDPPGAHQDDGSDPELREEDLG